MYNFEKYNPISEIELITLLGKLVSKKNKIAIIGGHFMLFYNKLNNELEPVIWQDLTNERHKEFAKQNAGNFPLRSFRYSVDLYKLFKHQNIQSGLVLLVNDHKFQSPNFQSEITDYIKGHGGELRKNFYTKNIIPHCYSEILKNEGISQKEILIDNTNLNREQEDLLPIISCYYSEQKLRNRFDDFVKADLIHQGYIRQEVVGKKINLYFQLAHKYNDFCLTENGSCACSAEVIEFITNLLKRNFFEIIFFVPNECAIAVDNGIMGALNINKITAKVFTVTNFGGMGFDEHIKRPYTITEHIYE